jgi:sugar-specific transcriptional regulator TrmB
MSNYRSVIGFAVALFLTLASATAFAVSSKIEVLGLAKLEIERLKVEKIGDLDKLRKEFRNGTLTKDEYVKGVRGIKESFGEAISTAQVAFRALKVELRGDVSDDVIDKAESDFNAAIDKAITELNSFLVALAEDLNLSPDDYIVSKT